jgi:hypothetical protein
MSGHGLSGGSKRGGRGEDGAHLFLQFMEVVESHSRGSSAYSARPEEGNSLGGRIWLWAANARILSAKD